MADRLTDCRILIVDDMESNVLLLEGILQQGDYVHFRSVLDSREAAAAFVEFQPDIVLLDLMMPHLDGFAVMQQLQPLLANQSYLPIVVLTADASVETKRRALAAGANDFLTKPLDAVEVLLRVKNLLQTRILYLQQQERAEERVRSIGLVTGGIAHDLNNMLAPILMAVDLLQLNRGVPASMVATLRSSAQRGTELVNQVLTFARGGALQAEPINLRHLISEVAQLARETFPRSIAITVDVPADLWMVKGDATQVHQVLMNLVVNARDAMPSGGTLAVSCRNAEGSEASPGRSVLLTVADSGTGIAPEIADRIFEPFFTTKQPGKGTGLGLATVREIVTKNGGTVRVASEAGNGSRFEVSFPALVDALPQPVAAPQPWATGHGELILVVDDEASLRRMVAMMLEAAGYRVLTAQNGAEALALYEEQRDRISVVLTDMTMPLMDGETLVRAVLAINPQARIIAASGVDIHVPEARASLRKPYSAERLLSALRAVLS